MGVRSELRKAVIPAAGLGTRLLPATKAVPKVMLPIVDKPVIQYVVEEAVASGIEQIVIVTAQSTRAIEDHFDTQFELEHRLKEAGRLEDLEAVRGPAAAAAFTFVRQPEPRGNGHAVLCARSAIGDEPFAMIFPDDIVVGSVPCLRQMAEVHARFGGAVGAVMRVPPEQVSQYGVVEAEPVDGPVYRVRSIVEKPLPGEAPSNLAAVHAWILPPRIFGILAETPPGKGGEIWLVDAIQELIREEPVYALEFEGRRYDVGHRLGLLQASIDFALEREDMGLELRAYLKAVVAHH